ncbi:MAG: F0F1 ATP synthase subunit epsilon [Chitinophagales bacterium]
MADNTYILEVVTPERIVLSEEVEFAVVPAAEGELGVLRNHAPLIAGLKVGVLRFIDKDGTRRCMAVAGGFMEVIDNEAKVLVETAEFGEEIDVLRAKAAKERAEARLIERQERLSHTRAEMALARALARLKAAEMDLKN